MSDTNSIDIDDDFLNLRFDPKFKQIFKDKIESGQEKVVDKQYTFPIKFIGKYDVKTEKVLKTMVQRVNESAGINGLTLKSSDPVIEFHTEDVWFADRLTDTNLPASSIKWQGTQPIIRIITPSSIISSEVLIKTVRLLFSKLYGSLYFKETVLNRNPYKESLLNSTDSAFDIKEKLHLCRILDDYSDAVRHQFKHLALSKRIASEKAIENGKNEFYRHLESQTIHSDEKIAGLLDEIFDVHKSYALRDSQNFYSTFIAKLYETLSKVGLVLPHEKKLYRFLKNRNRWELLDGIAEKSQYVLNSLSDLFECLEYLENYSPDNKDNYLFADYWINALNGRTKYLKRKGLVKLHLIEDARLSPDLQKDLMSFPLWVWKHRIFEFYSKKHSSAKTIQIITSEYKNSIYQKIFEAAFRAANCLKKLQQNPTQDIVLLNDFKRLKTLVAGLKIRRPLIEDILFSSRIAHQMTSLKRQETEKILKESKEFEAGWSYFISFALIHQFYLLRSTDKERAEKFLNIIQEHLEKRVKNQLSMQIAFLFLEIYFKNKYQLNEIVRVVREGSDAFEFFISNHMRIINRNGSISDNIHRYAESVTGW